LLILIILFFGERPSYNKSQRFLLGISVLPTFTGRTVCPIKLSLLFKIKIDAICTSTCPFGPSQSVPTDPVSAVPILSAHCLLPLVLSSRLLPPPIDSDIALYLHNSTSHHEHSYSKYALADCSLIDSILSNYDRSCVYSNSTVDVVAHCFTNVIIQAMNLAIPQVPLDSTHSPIVVFIR